MSLSSYKNSFKHRRGRLITEFSMVQNRAFNLAFEINVFINVFLFGNKKSSTSVAKM